MGVVIDSSVLIAAERGKLDLDQLLSNYAEDPVAIAAITASELLHGVHRAAEPLQRTFVGEPSNLCMSWLEAAAVLPIRVVQVCPVGYEADDGHLASLRAGAAGELQMTHDLESALVDVDLIYTDCWPKGRSAEEQRRIKEAFLPYQIQVQHLDRLGARGVFLPCPPVTRGEEVSEEAMRSPLCQNHAAKDNLLHVQNAIMETVAAAELGR